MKNKDVFFLIEHQAKIDYSMPLRILEYERAIIFSCLNDKKYKNAKYRFPSIIPIVFYTGKSKWNAVLDLKSVQEHHGEIYGEELSRYNIFDNNKFSDEELMKENNLLSQLILLERAKDENELEKSLNEILEQIKNLTDEEYSEQKKEILKSVINVLIRRIIGSEKTEDYLNKLEERDDSMEAVLEMIDREEKKKKIKYEKIGIKKGIERGINKTKTELIRNMLKENLPIDLISKITGLSQQKIKKIKLGILC